MWRKFFGNKFFLTALGIVVLMGLHAARLDRPIASGAVQIIGMATRPFIVIGKKLSDTVNFLASVRNLAKENARMSQEIVVLAAKNASLQEVAHENTSLRDQLKLQEKSAYDLATALVIARDPGNVANEITINKGSADGIAVDMPVVVGSGILVGRISETFDHAARVLLVTDTRSRVNVTTQETRASGILHGEHGLGLTLDTVPQNEALKQDDVIVTSGLGGIFPNGLVIGKIQDVTQAENALFQQAAIQPFFHLRDLDVVFVIVKGV